MKKTDLAIITLVGTCILFSSCSPHITSLTKRHYRSGYYVEYNAIKSRVEIASKLKTINYKKPDVLRLVDEHLNLAPIKGAEPKGRQSEPLSVNKSKRMITTRIGVGYIRKTPTENLAFKNNSTAIAKKYTGYSMVANTNIVNKYSDREAYVTSTPFWLVFLCAIFIPPLGVFLAFGIGTRFWVDLILTLLFFIPGMIFALVVVLAS
jgi:uncharacterized membrane protein YqaE (UPF0057 family)